MIQDDQLVFSSALCWNQSEDLIVTIIIGRKILHDLPICFFKLYSCCLIQFNLKSSYIVGGTSAFLQNELLHPTL